MNRPRLYNLTETGLMLGMTRQTVSEVAGKLGVETHKTGLPGRSRGLTMSQVRQIGRLFGIKPDPSAVDRQAVA